MSTAVALPVESAVEIPHLQLVTEPGSDKGEENRWMLAFGLPCLAAGLFVAAAIGTGDQWIWGLVLASLMTAICMLSWLAISSDTNS